jgi:hypothetical protein
MKKSVMFMKPKSYSVMLVSVVALIIFNNRASAQTTLFDDTYTRANLNSGQTGGGGQTGADVGSGINYTIAQWNVAANSAYTGSLASENDSTKAPYPNVTANNDGTLDKLNNGQMGIWSLGYNFTDAAILAAGGFIVSQNIISIGSNTAQPTDRFVGYGVGLNPTQISNFADDTASNVGPRGSVSANASLPGQTTAGVAPFYVDLDISGQVQVFEAGSGLVFTSGTLLNASPLGSAAKLTTDFTFANFNAGSTVNYSVFLTTNNVSIAVTSGTFDWTTTGNNYVAGSMRGNTDTAGVLDISTVPEPSVITMIVGGFSAMGLFIRRRKI